MLCGQQESGQDARKTYFLRKSTRSRWHIEAIGAGVPGGVKISDGYDSDTVKKRISLEAVTARVEGVSSAPS